MIVGRPKLAVSILPALALIVQSFWPWAGYVAGAVALAMGAWLPALALASAPAAAAVMLSWGRRHRSWTPIAASSRWRTRGGSGVEDYRQVLETPRYAVVHQGRVSERGHLADADNEFRALQRFASTDQTSQLNSGSGAIPVERIRPRLSRVPFHRMVQRSLRTAVR